MEQASPWEVLELPPPPTQRKSSMSSDRAPSVASLSQLSPPPVKPDPAYIAASAASQIVSSDRMEQGDESFDGANESDTAVVSPGSLVLVNAFLDHLLFSFLASARSTSISSLRPAILEVLKPRLGKEAIDGADEELEGYLAGGDAEELLAFHSGQEFRGEYNLNLIWRRTRLRCMVYTRLGDMEEEDEEMYLEDEQEEDANDGRPRLTKDLGSVSPAAAIFLTSIIEFIGEHALLVASEAAYNRSQTKQFRAGESRHLVEEVDMEKIAFNTTLGRLWRAWKKRVRTSTLLSPRPISRELLHRTSSSHTSRNASISEENEPGYFGAAARRPSVGAVLKEDRDTTEAEVPSRAGDLPSEPDFDEYSAAEATDSPAEQVSKVKRGRPRSMIEYSRPRPEPSMRAPTQTSALSPQEAEQQRPVQRRQRSSSVPARQTPYVSPVNETFTTPTEGPDPLAREGERADAEKALPKLTDGKSTVPELARGDQAVSTIYDGAISKSDETLPEALPKGIAERTNRGISTYTDTSNQTDEYDQQIAPEALKVKRPGDAAFTANSESWESTSPINFGFQGGEMDPIAHPEVLGQSVADDLNGPEAKDRENSRQHVGNFADLATISGHQLRTFDDSGKAVKRDIPVLYEAPSNEDVIYNPEASVRSSTGLDDEDELPTPKIIDQTHNDSHGVPPLSPLRELMEATGETSDEASSTSHSNDATTSDIFVAKHRSQGSGGPTTASYSSSSFNHAQPSISASKLVDLRAQPLPANAGTERAAVQRVQPLPTGTTNAGRTSMSSNRDGRPITASSNTSQLSSKIKGMIGRESGDLNRQPLLDRTSSGDGGSIINGSPRQPRSADKDVDFEQLMRSDQTVKYTLTPQNMREMESPNSPRWQTQSRSETADLADFIRTSGPNSPETEPSAGQRTTKLQGLNGLRSNPPNGTGPTAMAHGPISSIDTAKAQAKGRVLGPKSPGGIAREPTTKDDSVRDFADFIRSTGPDTGAKPVPRSVSTPIVKRSPSGSVSTPQTSSQGRPIPKRITKPLSVAGAKPEAEVPKRNTSKLQAREPTVTNSNATADLAEFLRSGPAGGQVERAGPGTQPGRRANGLANGRLRDAVNSGSSVASTQDSFAPSKMTQSSANSRTGLLDGSNRGAPAQRGGRSDDSFGPARIQRRVKDPYAIESDDDETDGHGTPQPPEREEESLADFLRNYDPPPTSTNARNAPVTLTGAPKPAKQSGPTIRERIARNIAVIPDYRPLPPKTPKKPSSSKSPPQSNESRKSAQRKSSTGYQSQSQNNNRRGRSVSSTVGAPQLPPINPRPASPHLVTQNGTKLDSYKPTQPTYAKHVERRPKQHLQARDEQRSVGGMGDLADFLRETEPPPPSGTRPMSPAKEKEKEESAFGRMFSRKKREIR